MESLNMGSAARRRRFGKKIVRTVVMMSLLLALVVTAFAPRASEAATARNITLSSYMSPVKCSYSGESYCSYADGAKYNLVMVHGTRFTPSGWVNLAFFINGNLVVSQNLMSDSAGSFWYQSKNFEFCQTGQTLTIQAMDLSNFGYSNVLTTRVC